MKSLLIKEIRGFFNSLTGYLVVIVFLLLNSLFLWILPGNFNILDGGYASLDNLFLLSPWVFLFLIPAITMRLFADEKRGGTMEFLLTKPITDLQIILAKYLAGLLLVILSVIPTLVFYYTVHELGNPVGNIDQGGTIGSYLGLVFLGGAYVAIGLFASSVTENQIISFILAAILSFFFFLGFDQIAGLEIFGNWDLVILGLGINEHYVSMSKGVLDTRDMIYFITLIMAFLLGTRLVLQSRKWE
ncbi:MAG: gliding motility-associated ABC transporter permease subunit GldF [Bacteroidota bacterium]|nr:gliding motility-associated ABC transporter permease subunit GldF [Bacteroidota bacterium]MDX5429037.1 gliding motility-associated ABC transporter permease subunit GldF [Bacteroidota bacterium]MDX5448321.1 gliding motility-associated ABC transporter permease subunit GldF [Bacteroidota bacterium]MDX5506701.1 gliding motility-associated ABC transporter permease subunit GldF [Bacteroidota bacterium]